MNLQNISRPIFVFLAVVALGVSTSMMADGYQTVVLSELASYVENIPIIKNIKPEGIAPFNSAEDFKAYLAKSAGSAPAQTGFGGRGGAMMESKAAAPLGMGEGSVSSDQSAPADRVSGTNVQVAGIDEPDIVKTDGENIFVSNENFYRFYPLMMEKRIMMDEGSVSESVAPSAVIGMPSEDRAIMPQINQDKTKIIKAYPAADLAKIGEIEKNGQLLISGNNLLVFSPQDVTGYDISNKEKPAEKWVIKMQNNTETAGIRLYDDKLYMVVKNQINAYRPCPVEPMMIGDKPVSIACGSIYHPISITPVDITYSAMIINPADGQVEKTISFIGSSGGSTMYMSADAIYMSYAFPGDLIGFASGFFSANKGLVPDSLIAKINKLAGYDLSYYTKTNELSVILEQYRASLDDDDRLKFDNELNNRMKDYMELHKRDLEKTGIAKIGVKSFRVESSGVIPGTLLNQFSMDEFEGSLRVASTIGQSGFWMFGFNGNNQSANDIYVLDKDMKIAGSVKDLGKGERIYSVRFIEDKGYVVTFKQIDPFYVIDLADPKQPVVKGELKIPGYSSYLHPIAKNIILGVGQENGQVKLSLFDVANPANPVEMSKYSLNEYWTEVSSNHHAFLQDAGHKIFFIPGGQDGYVFSYADNNLSLAKAISGIQASRALYIQDSLYIVGQDRITVLDESDWEKTGELELR